MLLTQYESLAHFEIIDQARGPNGTELYLLDKLDDSNIYLAYKGGNYSGKEDSFFNTMELSDFLKAKPSKEYNSEKQIYCLYCGGHEKRQLSGNSSQPDLGACHSCHDLLRDQLQELIDSNNHHKIVSRMI